MATRVIGYFDGGAWVVNVDKMLSFGITYGELFVSYAGGDSGVHPVEGYETQVEEALKRAVLALDGTTTIVDMVDNSDESE